MFENAQEHSTGETGWLDCCPDVFQRHPGMQFDGVDCCFLCWGRSAIPYSNIYDLQFVQFDYIVFFLFGFVSFLIVAWLTKLWQWLT